MQIPPSWKHQAISAELLRQFANYLVDKPCKAFTSPFDLILPDLLIVCDLDKLKGSKVQ